MPLPSANHCEAEMFSLPRDRQTDTRGALIPQSLTLSQSLQVFKGDAPFFFFSFFPTLLQLHCKSKILIFPHTLFFLYCRGKDLTLSSLPGFGPLALLSVQKMSLRRFSDSSSKLFAVLSGYFMILCHLVGRCDCFWGIAEMKTFWYILIIRPRTQLLASQK